MIQFPNPRHILVATALVVGLGACSLQLPGSGDPARLYLLSPKSTFAPDLPKVDWQLMVEVPVASAAINTNRIGVQRGGLSFEYFARASWTDTAPLMVQTLMVESFDNTGKIVSVGRDSIGLRADYLLKLELREFQAEMTTASGPTAVRVRVNAKLVKLPERQIIASTSAERRSIASDGSMENIVLAFDDTLGKVLKQLIEWTITTPAANTAQIRH